MEHTQATASNTKTATRLRQTAASSNSSKAFTIFKRLHDKKARHEVVSKIVEELGLSTSSANSYYQKFLHQGELPKRSTSGSRGRPIDESSKAGIARAIFKKVGMKKARKDVITQLIEQAGLTQAGAATYYQKLKHAA